MNAHAEALLAFGVIYILVGTATLRRQPPCGVLRGFVLGSLFGGIFLVVIAAAILTAEWMGR